MKCITREIRMYTYTFGKYDMQTAQVHDCQTITRPVPMTRKEANEITEKTGAMMIHKDVVPVKYRLPLEAFIAACEAYAVQVAEGSAQALSDADEYEDGVNVAEAEEL